MRERLKYEFKEKNENVLCTPTNPHVNRISGSLLELQFDSENLK